AGAHAADRSPTSQTGQAVPEAPSIDRHAGAGNAYLRLWEIVNALDRECRSEQRKYPPDDSRIRALWELQIRILSMLLPYERPKLKSIAPPPEPKFNKDDLTRLTDRELHQLLNILSKLENGSSVETQSTKPAAAARRKRHPDSASA